MVIYFEAADLAGAETLFTSLPVPVVVDHLGRPDVTKPVDGAEFGLFLRFMAENPNVWSKVSCPNACRDGPAALRGRRPFARAVVETSPRPGAVGHRLAAPQHEEPHAR